MASRASCETREILDGKARRQDLFGQQRGEGLQVVAMDGAREHEGVLVAVVVDVGGHGIEGIQHLGPGSFEGSAFAQHGPVRSANPSLPGSSSAAPTWKTRRIVTRGLDGDGRRTMRMGMRRFPSSARAEGEAAATSD
jgi:hypothetical protein